MPWTLETLETLENLMPWTVVSSHGVLKHLNLDEIPAPSDPGEPWWPLVVLAYDLGCDPGPDPGPFRHGTW